MKKRTFTIILVILAVLAAVWLSNYLDLQTADTLSQSAGGLVLLDGETQTLEPAPSAEETTQADETTELGTQPEATQAAIDENGSYTSSEDVSLYLNTYGRLPENFITKSEARALGWSGGGLDNYSYGKCIGGDRFGNNEGLLPESGGRQYYECDIDTLHRDSRGAKRIVFSNDGLIYFTQNHYDSFELLYGEP